MPQQAASPQKLIRLGDTNLAPQPADDIRGRRAFDSRGEEIGDVLDLMIDDREKHVRFLLIESGGFLGIGKQRYLIPVNAITSVDNKQVRVNLTRDRVAAGPVYDPELVDARHMEDVYAYYGMIPFWAAGYMNPAFPFYL